MQRGKTMIPSPSKYMLKELSLVHFWGIECLFFFFGAWDLYLLLDFLNIRAQISAPPYLLTCKIIPYYIRVLKVEVLYKWKGQTNVSSEDSSRYYHSNILHCYLSTLYIGKSPRQRYLVHSNLCLVTPARESSNRGNGENKTRNPTRRDWRR